MTFYVCDRCGDLLMSEQPEHLLAAYEVVEFALRQALVRVERPARLCQRCVSRARAAPLRHGHVPGGRHGGSGVCACQGAGTAGQAQLHVPGCRHCRPRVCTYPGAADRP